METFSDTLKYIGEYVHAGSSVCPIYGYVKKAALENGIVYCYISDRANPDFLTRVKASEVRKPTGLGYEKI